MNLLDFRLQQYFDSFVAEQLQQRGSHVAVFTTGELRLSLDDRHARAEASKGLRQFKPDVTASQNNKVFG